MGGWGVARRALLVLVGAAAAVVLAACEPDPSVLTLRVTTEADLPDAVPGDGVCDTGTGACSLRAAVDEANADATHEQVTIALAGGSHTLLGGGGAEDANASGDLDLAASADVVVTGGGATITGNSALLDIHGGRVQLVEVGLTRSFIAGARVRTGAELVLLASASHRHHGHGITVDPGGQVEVLSSTVADNRKAGVVADGHLVATHATIAGNGQAGIAGSGTATLAASALEPDLAPDCAPTVAVTSGGGNVSASTSCSLHGPGDREAAAVGLDPLTEDAVPVRIPRWGSEAIDAVDGTTVPCHAVDQRLAPRPSGPACDAGAVERPYPPDPYVVDDPGDATDAVPGDGACATSAGTCTLRAAVAEAHRYPDDVPATIALATDVQLTGAGGELTVYRPLAIEGGGHVVRAEGTHRLLRLPIARSDVALVDVTLTGGRPPADQGGGAVLVQAGRLTATASAITDSGDRSLTAHGGGIAVTGGTVELTDVTLAGNAARQGGGLWVEGTTASITGGVVEGNAASGGGIGAEDATLVVDGTTIRANDAPWGGAMRLLSSDTTVRDVTLLGNGGGGIEAFGGELLIERSTLAGNLDRPALRTESQVAVRNTTIADNGSAVAVEVLAGPASSLDIALSTIAGNVGTTSLHASAPTTVQASVIAPAAGAACGGTPPTTSHVRATDDSCDLQGPGDVPSAAVLLSSLGDHGGPTPTRAPYTGSPLLDAVPAGTPGLCDGSIATDQRGVPRPAGDACDVGAVEGDAGGAPPALSLRVDDGGDRPDAIPDGVCDDGTGACTLRAAVDEANANPAHDAITLAVDVTLALPGRDEDGNATGDLDALGSLTIDGAGHTLDAGGHDRALHHAFGSLDVSHLTVRGGRLDADVGAGIRSAPAADVALTGVHLVDNRIDGGGVGAGADVDALTVAITASTIEANHIAAPGFTDGGVAAGARLVASGTLEVTASEVVGNSIAGSTNSQANAAGLLVRSPQPTLIGVTVVGNSSEGRSLVGGGLYAHGSLHLEASTVAGNDLRYTGSLGASVRGAGVWATNGDHVVLDTEIRDNVLVAEHAYPTKEGAGLGVVGPLRLERSRVVGNVARGPGATGAGVFAYSAGSMTILDSTVQANVQPLGGQGAGVWVPSGTALIVDRSTVAANLGAVTGSQGGGIYHQGGGSVAVRQSSIVDNVAVGGAGIWAGASPVELVLATVAGGDGLNLVRADVLSLSGSIVAIGPIRVACFATTSITSGGWNLASDATCGPTGPGDLPGTDPLLEALADNGGPTATRMPGVGSPALDAIPAGTAGLCDGTHPADQRGSPRPVGPACDIGATER